jgi:flavin reductase (DIM6/NTAB) family NADH-FMN oxidoreductase RutF
VFFECDPPAGQPRNGGLPWDPFKALVAPRPIGWITTVSTEGVVNLAPFSYFNAIADKPNLVLVSTGVRPDGEQKHSQRNAEATGEFVCNVVSWDLREAMNLTSAAVDADVDEAEMARIELAKSRLVAPPRVAAAPGALECVHLGSYPLPLHRDGSRHPGRLVVGEVVGVYIDDRFVREGRVDSAAMRLVARMGYDEFSVAESSFRMSRPDLDIMGLLGSRR